MRAFTPKVRRERDNTLKALLGVVAGLAVYEAINSLDETKKTIAIGGLVGAGLLWSVQDL